MANINNIIPNGSTVITVMGKIEAIIIGVCVRGSSNDFVEYNIAWMASGERKTDWVQAFELKLKVDNSAPAGFRNNNQTLLEK